ncbi:hypothetical protein V8E54_011644 [Elaphomyces granulatus]
MPAHKPQKRASGHKSNPKKNRLQRPTSHGDPLLPIASPNLESQAQDDQDILIPPRWTDDKCQLDGLVDSFGFEYFGFEPRLAKAILTDNTGSFLVECEGQYYFASLIAGSLYRLDEPKDLDSILPLFSQNRTQNIRMTEIMELDDTDN